MPINPEEVFVYNKMPCQEACHMHSNSVENVCSDKYFEVVDSLQGYTMMAMYTMGESGILSCLDFLY